MPITSRRAVRLAAVAALPLVLALGGLSTGALAQALAPPAAAPPARVTAPTVQPPAGAAPAGVPTVVSPAVITAPAPAAPQVNESVAALVNDDIISSYDLRQRMRLLVATSGLQVTEENLPQLEQEALRGLIDERLQSQEIKRISKKQKSSDFIADDKEIDDEIGDIAKQNNLNYAQMKASFAASGIDIQTMREQIRTQITWQRLVGGIYGRAIRVGDDQINKVLQRMSDQASRTQYLVGEIFLDSSRPGGQQRALDDANALIAQIQAGSPFAAVARSFSASPTAANGGDTGWITASQTQPEVAKALEELRPGQLSMPIPVSDGVYVVFLREKKAASGQMMVSLKQAAVRLDKDASAEQVAAATASLRAIKSQIKGCENIEQVANKTTGVISADLGEADLADLRGPFKEAAEKLPAGSVSDPIRTDVGMHLVAVCAKHSGGSSLPSRTDITNRLQSEQLAVMSRRYLRDLRNSATIEAR
jgi:peptidyl-prolyl cis-trans isomerase SurA